MKYSYYPDRILTFDGICNNGESYKDEEYGTGLECTETELFPEEMKALLK